MQQIVLDAATTAALLAAQQGAELIGPDGKPVGGFVPRSLLQTVQSYLADRRKQIDDANASITMDELRAIDARGGGIPHAEVMRRLGLDR